MLVPCWVAPSMVSSPALRRCHRQELGTVAAVSLPSKRTPAKRKWNRQRQTKEPTEQTIVCMAFAPLLCWWILFGWCLAGGRWVAPSMVSSPALRRCAGWCLAPHPYPPPTGSKGLLHPHPPKWGESDALNPAIDNDFYLGSILMGWGGMPPVKKGCYIPPMPSMGGRARF